MDLEFVDMVINEYKKISSDSEVTETLPIFTYEKVKGQNGNSER